MAGAKEIRTKIKSIQSIKKTTKAMQMVSASKMRKTQEAMLAARPYAQEILHIAGHIVKSNPEYKHPYMEERKVRRVGYIIVSTDRGLCGGLNTVLFKAILADMQANTSNHIETQVVTFGSKAESFFKRVKTKVVASTSHLGDRPSSYDLIGGVKVMLDAYDQCEVDKVYLCYNQFVNTMTLKPVLQQILPVAPLPVEDLVHQHAWDYLYEPEPKKLLEFLLQRFVESQVYQAVTENIASEQAARMVAMKSATDNAVEVIDELKLVYNKARQASITQELSEIVAGAAAV